MLYICVMNKDKLITALSNCSESLQSELDYYLNDVDHEDEYGITDALEDYIDGLEGNNKQIPMEVKRIFIACGYCIPVDISTVYVSHGRKYWFIVDKQHYDVAASWANWINN